MSAQLRPVASEILRRIMELSCRGGWRNFKISFKCGRRVPCIKMGGSVGSSADAKQ